MESEVRWFDEESGHAVKALCPHPENNNDDTEPYALYEAHKEVIARARCESTIAGILVEKKLKIRCECAVSEIPLSVRQSSYDLFFFIQYHMCLAVPSIKTTGRKRTTVLV